MFKAKWTVLLLVAAAMVGWGSSVLAAYEDYVVGNITLRVYGAGETLPGYSGYTCVDPSSVSNGIAEIERAAEYLNEIFPNMAPRTINVGFAPMSDAYGRTNVSTNSILIGSSWSWSSPDGPVETGYTILKVMTHELGHAFGISASYQTTNIGGISTVVGWSNGSISKFTQLLQDSSGKMAAPGQQFTNPSGDNYFNATDGGVVFTGKYATQVYGGDVLYGGVPRPIPIESGQNYGLTRPGVVVDHLAMGNSMMDAGGSDRVFFSEVELGIFIDIGNYGNVTDSQAQQILRSHFGLSEYRDNQSYTNTRGFGNVWNEGTQETQGYYDNAPNTNMYGVGLHIVGASNEITQAGNLLTTGYGGTGIRIENNNNTVTIAPECLISANGDHGVGVLVTAGSGTSLINRGDIEATGPNGRAVWFNASANQFDNTGTINAGATNDAIYIGANVQVSTINFMGNSVVIGNMEIASGAYAILTFGKAFDVATGMAQKVDDGNYVNYVGDPNFRMTYSGNIFGGGYILLEAWGGETILKDSAVNISSFDVAAIAKVTLDGVDLVSSSTLTKTGVGTMVFNNVTSAAVPVNVNAGSLLFSGTNTINGAVTVQSGATLGGNGSVVGSVAVQSGGIVASGASAAAGDPLSGTLTITNLALYTGSALEYYLGSSSGSVLNSMFVTDSLQILDSGSGRVTVDLMSGGAIGIYPLIQYGTLTGDIRYLTVGSGVVPGYYYTFQLDNSSSIHWIDLVISNETTPKFYWTGNSQPSGSVDALSWRNNLNWSDHASGSPTAATAPAAGTDVIFAASTGNNISGNITTTLDGDYNINSLTFLASPSATNITIGAGASGSLTLTPDSLTKGISIEGSNTSVTIASSVPVYLGGSQTWQVAAGSSLEVDGDVCDAPGYPGSALTKTGAGTLEFSNMTANVPVTVSEGTLLSDGMVTVSGLITVGSGTTLNVANASTLFASGGLSVDNAMVTLNPGSSSNPGGMLRLDAGVATTFTGTSLIKSDGSVYAGQIHLNGASQSFNVVNSGDKLTLDGVNVVGSGTLTTAGRGTLVFNNVTTEMSLVVNMGTLELSGTNTIGVNGTGTVTLNNGWPLVLDNGTTLNADVVAYYSMIQGTGTLSGNLTVPGSPLNISDYYGSTVSRVEVKGLTTIGIGGSKSSLYVNLNAELITSGGLSINSGTLEFDGRLTLNNPADSGPALTSTGQSNIYGPGPIVLNSNRSFSVAAPAKPSDALSLNNNVQVVSGNGDTTTPLTKDGPGTMEFYGATTEMPVQVNAGSLLFYGNNHIGGAVSILSGATVGGDDSAAVTIGGTGLNVAQGATLQVGNNRYMNKTHLTISGPVTIHGTLSANLYSYGGGVADLLTVDSAGSLILGDNATLNLLSPNNDVGLNQDTLYKLIEYSGTDPYIGNEFKTVTFDGNTLTSNQYLINYTYQGQASSGTGMSYYVTIALVPEPSTWVMLLTAGIMGGVSYWRRKIAPRMTRKTRT